ncbi:tRNA pseudouridine38-40 synthase [Siphonobacter aquaeclarae]|jgi:tRNA pseudouridine38-40 synthase|uniref:tRNA pseudouridine synthase A n=2 Tax=Siphonobacter aquaeclarae TaxID=563176 RepID=A0A1G9KQL0_9BACT|nr:tRNA pseudouridine38-40 synthase [Siphonobacter aquaeclarae]
MIELAYNGSGYNGWQRQPNAVSVQEELEKGLSLLLREPINLIGSGRTDTGVHAAQQFAHFDREAPIEDIPFLLFKLNHVLSQGIAVYRIFPVADTVHARFTATSRKYEYHIARRKTPFRPAMVYPLDMPLDIEAMNEAGKILLQHEDFQSFSLVKTQVKTFRCRITEARWVEEGTELVFHVRADRFLRGMVRALVGTLLEVGRNRLSLAELEEIILAKDRRKAGRAVPPDGLFLMEVTYPENAFSPPVCAS